MSFTSKHLITEINKAIAKCDAKISDIISSDEELREVFDIITEYICHLISQINNEIVF